MSTAKEDALIFISWSGETSKGIALALRDLLRNSIHTANPWMSESDGDKGARWRSEIEKKLEAAIAGIIVVTGDNQNAPWLLFESGALSKKNERVYTYLSDLKKGDVRDPLGQFNHTSLDYADTLKMLKGINLQLGEHAVQEERMVKAFKQNWGEFESNAKQIPASPTSAPPPDSTEMMQQALVYLREQSASLASLNEAIDRLTIAFAPPRYPPPLPAVNLEALGISGLGSVPAMSEGIERARRGYAESSMLPPLPNLRGLANQQRSETSTLPPRPKVAPDSAKENEPTVAAPRSKKDSEAT